MKNKGRFVAYDVDHDYFNSMTGMRYWVIGLLAADGSVNKKGNRICISQSGPHGKFIIELLKKELKFKGKINVYKNSYSIQFTSKKIANYLSRFNVVNKKTLKYNLPDKLANDPTQYRDFRDFFRGYFYGDGSIGIYDNGKGSTYLCCSVVGTEDFITRSRLYIPHKGSIRSIDRCTNLYELRWYGKSAIAFSSWLYSNKTLPKTYKYEIYKKGLNLKTRCKRYDEPKAVTIRLSKEGLTPDAIYKELLSKGYSYIKKSTIYNWRYKYV